VKARQRGLTTVEFAVAGGLALTILFGCIEISRALYVWNSIGEATRRAAHVAAICPMNHAAIAQAAMLAGTSSSSVLYGLTPAKVVTTYLDSAGNATTTLGSVEYVRVAIAGYTHTLAIPFVGATLTVPAFTTTVPAESLGYLPDTETYGCLGT
jgi:Flp pilus assembly protein TadG